MMLRTRYMNLQLPRVQWLQGLVLPLEKYYVHLMLQQTSDSFTSKLSSSIALEEIFQSVDNDVPYRILVEGAPGYGKTTFALKLAYDWSKNVPYLAKFDLVFVLLLRYCEFPIEMMLAEEAAMDSTDSDTILKAIKLNMENVLLILDGYDEMNDDDKKMLLPLLERKKIPQMTILVTSRSGKFSEFENFSSRRPDQIFSRTEFWNKKITIKGLNESQQEVFLKTYLFPEYSLDMVSSKFKSVVGSGAKELMSCPLFLLLLAMLIEDSDLRCPQNKTDLYVAVFNFMIRRWLSRENYKDEIINIKCWSLGSLPFCVDLLCKFGSLAYKMLHEDQMIFTEDEILSTCDNQILNVGFLTKAVVLRRKRLVNFYEPLHKSLLEFLAAFYLWNVFLHEEIDSFKTKVIAVLDLGLQKLDNSLFFPFLAGLLGDKVSDLYKILRNIDYQYSSYFYALTGILLESHMSDDLVRILMPFTPHRWMISWYVNDEGFSVSPTHSSILRCGLLTKRIKIVQWNIQNNTHFPPQCKIDRLVLLIKEPKCVFSSCKGMKCSELLFYFGETAYKFDATLIENFMTEARIIASEKISLELKHVAPDFLSVILKIISEEFYRKKIRRLSCLMYDFNSLEMVHNFLKKVSVQILDLCFQSSKSSRTKSSAKHRSITQRHLNSFLQTVADDSSRTEELIFLNSLESPLVINLQQLCKNGARNWQKLWFTNFNIQIDVNNAMDLHIEELRIFSVKDIVDTTKALRMCNCKAIACGIEILYEAIKNKAGRFRRMDGLEELTVLLKSSTHVLMKFDFLSCFRNLNVLSIQLSNFKFENELIDELIQILTNLSKLETFEIWYAEQNVMLLQCLIERISLLKPVNSSPKENVHILKLKCMKIQFSAIGHDFEIFSYNLFMLLNSLRHLLESEQIERLMVIVPRNLAAHVQTAPFLGRIFSFEENFIISHDMDGMNANDSRNSRICYDYNTIFDRYTIIWQKNEML